MMMKPIKATRVTDYLIEQGVSQNLVSAQAFGDANPVAPNDTPEVRARNHRIEATLRGLGT